jgi:hypothetical protein
MIPTWLRDKILGRRRAWQRLMMADGQRLKPDAEVALKDLARFCRAHRSTAIFSPVRGAIDPIASARADGRREVYLRIIENLHLDERFLVNLREGANDND